MCFSADHPDTGACVGVGKSEQSADKFTIYVAAAPSRFVVECDRHEDRSAARFLCGTKRPKVDDVEAREASTTNAPDL